MIKPDSSDIKLSVLVTVYSETFSVVETINRVRAKNRQYIHEIILVVAPKSSDECMEICEKLAVENDDIRLHLQKNNPGVGWAIREGMELAQGDYIALLSADLETEPEAVDRMVRKFEETGCDLVIGNRWMKGGGFTNYDPFKFILNWSFQLFFRILYNTKIGDLTYGMKIMRKEMVDAITWTGTLHEIFIETTVRPIKLNYHVEQVPTVWIGRLEGESKNSFSGNFRYVKLAFDVLFNR
ncbi:MAG TPA: glycosyltransferase [Gammaproteobacteria bacterium]|jgi:dolichol-phosphate mannosyltransferase|nr:glycosyltransferase [Gammaproteobacteria bacterium]